MKFNFYQFLIRIQRVSKINQVKKTNEDVVSQVEKLKDKRSTLQKISYFEEDNMLHRIKRKCIKWIEATGLFCDKIIEDTLEGKIYKTVVRPVMMNDSECEQQIMKRSRKLFLHRF